MRFFIKLLLLVPIDKPRNDGNDFDFFRIFIQFSVDYGASPMQRYR
jgi:hypothetical protein